MFLEISQNSQKNTHAKVSFLIKLQVACNFIKKETLAQVFSVNFVKSLRTPFLQNTSGRLLLVAREIFIRTRNRNFLRKSISFCCELLCSWISYFQIILGCSSRFSFINQTRNFSLMTSMLLH